MRPSLPPSPSPTPMEAVDSSTGAPPFATPRPLNSPTFSPLTSGLTPSPTWSIGRTRWPCKAFAPYSGPRTGDRALEKTLFNHFIYATAKEPLSPSWTRRAAPPALALLRGLSLRPTMTTRAWTTMRMTTTSLLPMMMRLLPSPKASEPIPQPKATRPTPRPTPSSAIPYLSLPRVPLLPSRIPCAKLLLPLTRASARHPPRLLPVEPLLPFASLIAETSPTTSTHFQ